MRIACPEITTDNARRGGLLIAFLASALVWLLLAGPLPAADGPDPGETLESQGGSSPPPALPAAMELKETTSLSLAVVKALAALAVVLGLIMLTTRLLKRLGWGADRPGGGSLIRMVETRMIAPKKYVAILQVAGELIVVGVTDQQINLLAKLDHSDSLQEELAGRQSGAPLLNGSFAAILRRAAGRAAPNGQP